MTHKYFKKGKIPAAAIVCLAFAVILMIIVGGFAKYRTEMRTQSEMIAADFHISSDYLEEAEKNASYDVLDWTKGIDIWIYNYEKENVRQIASEDISYQVTVNGADVTYKVYAENGSEVILTETENVYVLPSNNSQKTKQRLHLNVANLTESKSITVTVTSTKPFEKSLTAVFKVGPENPTIEVERNRENGDYYLVTVHSGRYSGDIKLNWNTMLVPDNTNEKMRNWKCEDGSGSFKADTFTSYKLIFFNPKSLDKAENMITLSTEK